MLESTVHRVHGPVGYEGRHSIALTFTNRSLIVAAFFLVCSVRLFSDPNDEARISNPLWYVSDSGIARCTEAMSLIIISYLAPYSLYMKNRFTLDNVS